VYEHELRDERDCIVVPDGYLVAMRSTHETCSAFVVCHWVVPLGQGVLGVCLQRTAALDPDALVFHATKRLMLDLELGDGSPGALRAMRVCVSYLASAMRSSKHASKWSELLQEVDCALALPPPAQQRAGSAPKMSKVGD
jgi:hypothetical protein